MFEIQFQEYKDSDHPKLAPKQHAPKKEIEDEELGKKRVAHAGAESSMVRKVGPSQPYKKQLTADQVMYRRWNSVKEAVSEKMAQKEQKPEIQATATKVSTVPTAFVAPKPKVPELPKISEKNLYGLKNGSQVNGHNRVRVAHVPYAMSLTLAKQQIPTLKPKEVETKTAAQTTKRARVAHIPQVVIMFILFFYFNFVNFRNCIVKFSRKEKLSYKLVKFAKVQT